VGITGTAQAAPPPNAVHYETTATPRGTMIKTDAGSLAIDKGVFEIKSPTGKVLAGSDLSFRVDDFVFPIAAKINGRTATLTPPVRPRPRQLSAGRAAVRGSGSVQEPVRP
jgi:hypothetical protein